MRSYIKIDKEALKYNYTEIKKKSGKDIMAVIKGNAYGHGIKEIAKELAQLGCSSFCVATLEEGLALRKSLIFNPILLLENTADLKAVLSMKLTLAVISIEQLKDLVKTRLPLRVQLFFDLGMKRDGILASQAPEALDLVKHSNLIMLGIFGHHAGLANYKKEKKVMEEAKSVFGTSVFYHHLSSNYIDKKDDSPCLRIGGALFGLNEIGGYELKTVMKLIAPIWCIKEVKKDEAVGYLTGSRAPGDGYIYTIPIGYADGFSRNTRIIGELKGEKVFAAAPMMMNHTLMFSSKLYQIGEEFELINSTLNPLILSKFYNMIPYEITTSLSPLLKRIVQ